MQTISVYLYPNQVQVYTNSFAEPLSERYRRVYNNNLKVHRGVDNKLDFRVMNSDQRKSNIGTASVVFSLIGKETQELIIKKDCTIQDATEGILYTILSQAELMDIQPGFYQYSLYSETRTTNSDNTYTVTSRKPLYIDSQYGALATIEVFGDVSGEPIDSVVVSKFAEHGVYTEDRYYISELIDANPQLSVPQSWHTFQFQMTNYTGAVTIEGSQSAGGNPHVWVALSDFDLAEQTTHYENIQGKYNWFRIKHTPYKTSSVASFTVAQTILLLYVVDIGNPGKGYTVGDTILIEGDKLGGESPTNNLTITVTEVDNIGQIKAIDWTGLSYNGVKTFVQSGYTPNIGTIDSVIYR